MGSVPAQAIEKALPRAKEGTARRILRKPVAAKMRLPAMAPRRAYQGQSGCSTTPPFKGNFWIRWAFQIPQLAPATPSSSYFQGWSKASMRL